MKEMNFITRRLAVCLAAVGMSSAASAFEVVLQDRDGNAFDDSAAIEFSTSRSVAGGIETVRCKVKAKSDGVRMLRITASDKLPGATRAWNGRDEMACPKSRYSKPLYFDYTFLMGALWKDHSGLALGTGAEDFNSHADLILEGDTIAVSVHATLMRAGSVYECTFHRIAFDPKYGIRDALARYYPLYPKRFLRNPEVTEGFYGICAEYGCWWKTDPEACRFMNATWEWCFAANRIWGDLLNVERPQGKCWTDYCWVEQIYCMSRAGKYSRLNNSKLTSEEFEFQLSDHLANGYYCGVANGFYTMLIAYISNAIGNRYPDSLAVGDTSSRDHYHYAAEVFTFPECSWGREVRRQVREVAARHDLGGMAFDVSDPDAVYRGKRLAEMKNVSWDRGGPGVVRGIANGKFYDFIRTVPNKKLPGKMAVASNSFYEHVSDLLYLDMTMFERSPWAVAYPFPLQGRYALGEKGLTLWEGYETGSFDPNFGKWPAEDQAALVNDLARFSIHRSMLTGASLPGNFYGEYVTKLSHAFIRMNRAGWKPVTGAVAKDGSADVARYGLGESSWLAVCNLTNAERRVALDVFPGEIECGLVGGTADIDGYVYAPFFGGEAEQRVGGGTERVSVPVSAMGVRVLEAVGRVRGGGTLFAEWKGDGCGKMSLVLRSADFAGEIECRREIENYRLDGDGAVKLKAGGSAVLEYRDGELLPIAEALDALSIASRKSLTVEYGDADSKEMAERIAHFFRSAAKRGVKMPVVSIRKRADFGRLGVSLEGCRIAADDRVEFSRKVRRVLNVLNARLCPDYCSQPPMENSDRKFMGMGCRL